MRLAAIAGFEIGYRLRRPSTWIFAVALIALPPVAMKVLANEGGTINSPVSTATAMTLVGMVGMMVTAAVFGDAATRDADTGMRPLFYTVPLGKLDYLGGRFLGALVANAILLLFIPLGLLLGTKLPFDERVTFLPFSAATYIEPLLTIALPNVLVTAAVLFTVAALSRQTLPGYLAVVGLFIGYVIAAEMQSRMASR